MRKSILLFLAAGLLGGAAGAAAGQSPEGVFTLDEYLRQVRTQNGSYRSAVEKQAGARGVEREADLVFGPSLFADAEARSDQEPGYQSLYRQIDTQSYDLGLSYASDFGLQAKVYYEFSHDLYYLQGDRARYSNGSWVAKVSLPLLKNGFGRSDRANGEISRFQARADAWNAETTRREMLVSAEIAYWQLAVCRELVGIQQRALEATQSIFQYNRQRAGMNLTDRADMLQSRADLESKKLSLKTAQDNENAALRNFNACRNAAPGETPPALQTIDYGKIHNLEIPETHAGRPDVMAAEAEARVAEANACIKEENNKPALDAYVGYALNGGAESPGDAVSDSFGAERPTAIAGVAFAMPLNMAAAGDARAGARRQAEAARLAYEQKLRDQESDWADLLAKLKNAKERFLMSITIEEAQKLKLDYERERLKRGRTSTYQVLQFEGDYLNAEYSRASAAYEVLNLSAQTCYYQPAPEPVPGARKE